MKLLALILTGCCACAIAAPTTREAVVGVCSLDVGATSDDIHLLTAERDVNGLVTLQYRHSSDAGQSWELPVVVGSGQPPTIAKRGMDAQIAGAGDTIVAVWPTAGPDRMGRGPMASAFSRDRGKTWTAGPNPADDNLDIGHSFIDLVADASGRFHLAWLDSRDGEAKGLRYARSSDGGATWFPNQTLDPDTCECCWNTLAVAPDGAVSVLYRRKNPRDMAIVSSTDTGATWGSPVAVGTFGWQINACPHVGGALAFARDNTYATVWTARDTQSQGVYLLRSSNTGRTWSAPARVGPPEASRPDLTIDRQGNPVVTYDAYLDGQGVWVISAPGATPVRLSDRSASATHGRLVPTATGVRAFWTEKSTGQPARWVSKIVVSDGSIR